MKTAAFKPLINILILLLAITFGCKKGDEEPPLSDENLITEFAFRKSVNGSLAVDVDAGVITGTEIELTVPFGTALELTPTIEISDGATISPASGVPINFEETNPASYTVTAENGDEREYKVTVEVAQNTECKIKTFVFEQKYNTGVLTEDTELGEISEENNTIKLNVPYNTDVKNLVATFEVSEGATVTVDGITQVSGVTDVDFTGDVIYTVTAQDGTSTQEYTVKVTEAPASSECEIKTFVFEEKNNKDNLYVDVDAGVITGPDITLTVPFGTALELTPTIEISDDATINPASGVPVNFGLLNHLTYTVTAENGDEQDYKVTVTVAENTANDIIWFKFEHEKNDELDIDVDAGEIEGTNIELTVPRNTNITELIASFEVSEGATVKVDGETQVSGTTKVDFSDVDGVKYIVEAEDGSTQEYTVTVKEAKNSASAITSFVFEEKNNKNNLYVDVDAGVITGTDIPLIVPFGTDLELTPTIGISDGATISPDSGESVDFSSSATQAVEYTVTSEDNTTTETYRVEVTVASETDKEITSFVFEADKNSDKGLTKDVVAEDVTGPDITLIVPYNTNVASLTPTITIKGKHITPKSGEAISFESFVTYTVTAGDDTTQDYKVTVNKEEASTASDILRFAFEVGDNKDKLTEDVVVENITSTDITLEVPYGTNLELIPRIEISEYASIDPESGVLNDFSNSESAPVEYEVTAQDDETTKVYEVTVKETPASDEKEITLFDFEVSDNPTYIEEKVEGDISPEDNTIRLKVPFGTDVHSLRPRIEISEYASISPESGVLNDFSNSESAPVEYEVTAQDETSQTYYVTVVIENIPRPTFTVLSYNNGANRIGAGDLEKPDLFQIGDLQDGSYDYSLKIDNKDAGGGTLSVLGGKASIGSTLLASDWNEIDDGNITIVLTLEGSTFSYNTTKEQYSVKSWQDLQGMKYGLSGDYTLMNDIELPDPSQTGGTFPEELPAAGFDPVGGRFTGSFSSASGEIYVISNLFIDRGNDEYVGLFAYAFNATIENVGIEISDGGVTGHEHAGGLMGYNRSSTVNNITITGGSIKSTQKWDDTGYEGCAGSLVGFNHDGSITNCYATGTSILGGINLGGLVGFNLDGSITDSYATGSVSGGDNSGTAIGGLVGEDVRGTITNCYATGSVSVGSTFKTRIGGLVGRSASRIIDCYATGSVTGGESTGGLVGINYYGSITDSYATGSVMDGKSNGGLVGYNHDGSITDSYATGSVTGGVMNGGLVGEYRQGTITKSYWDKGSTGQSGSAGGKGTGVSSGAYLEKEGAVYIDKEADGNGTTNVFVDWSISDDDTETWKWRGNGQWPVLTWPPPGN